MASLHGRDDSSLMRPCSAGGCGDLAHKPVKSPPAAPCRLGGVRAAAHGTSIACAVGRPCCLATGMRRLPSAPVQRSGAPERLRPRCDLSLSALALAQAGSLRADASALRTQEFPAVHFSEFRLHSAVHTQKMIRFGHVIQMNLTPFRSLVPPRRRRAAGDPPVGGCGVASHVHRVGPA